MKSFEIILNESGLTLLAASTWKVLESKADVVKQWEMGI